MYHNQCHQCQVASCLASMTVPCAYHANAPSYNVPTIPTDKFFPPQPSAGNKELREQILTLWRKEFPPRMNSDYMPEDLLNDLVDLITASNQQLLRELEGQAEYQQCKNCKGSHLLEVVPLSIIQDKLKRNMGGA